MQKADVGCGAEALRAFFSGQCSKPHPPMQGHAHNKPQKQTDYNRFATSERKPFNVEVNQMNL